MNSPWLTTVLDAYESGLPVAFVFDTSSLFTDQDEGMSPNVREMQRFFSVLEELSSDRVSVCLLNHQEAGNSVPVETSDEEAAATSCLRVSVDPDEPPDRALVRLMRRLPSDVFLVFVTHNDLDSALEEFVHWVGGIHLSVGVTYPPLLGYGEPDLEHLASELVGFADRIREFDHGADQLDLTAASFRAASVAISPVHGATP